MSDSIHAIIERLGYLGVALLVALENLVPPIPSEAVLPLAGFMAGRGDASLVGMIAAATAGSVVGAWLLYGIAALVGRCVPLLRSLVSVPAGFHHMPVGLFTVYTGLGSLVWNSALIGAGALLGDQWERVGDVVGLLQTGVIVVLAVVAAALLWRYWLRAGSAHRISDDPR